jgi:hypothetical protein
MRLITKMRLRSQGSIYRRRLSFQPAAEIESKRAVRP